MIIFVVRIFKHAPFNQSTIPAQHLQTILDVHQRNAMTGIVTVERPGGETFLLLFLEGMMPAAYQQIGTEIKEKPYSELMNLAAEEMTTLRTLPLPPEGVQAARLLLLWHPPSEEVQCEPDTVRSQIDAWNAQPIASAVHIIWPDAEGLTMLMGNAAPLEEAIFMTDAQVESRADALSAIFSHSADPCTLTRYTASADRIARHEELVQLHKAFDSLIDAVIGRYAELVGTSLSEKTIASLNTQAQTEGWEIKIATTGVVNTHTFQEPQEAAQAYRALLEGANRHIASVIGKRLANLLFLDATVRLSSEIQRTTQAYSLIPLQEMRQELQKRSL